MLCSKLTRPQSNALYLEYLKVNDIAVLRRLCREDLFFLLTIAFKRKDINHDWLYSRVREVESEPNECLDLWAREHYKSTIITYGKGIQDILASHGENPLPIWGGQETTMGIFSHVKSIAKDFLNQIKRELEDNSFLKNLFPDILWADPKREAPVWSIDKGLLVKRKSNPKELTVEAHGLVDGQPTGKHFLILNYDDVVTRESVTTTEQLHKVTDAWALSLNLGAKGGFRRYIGTRYHANDTYATMMARGSAKVRLHAATDDGTLEGTPVFLTRRELDKKRADMGPYIFSAQMLQNPTADKAMGFKREWIKHYDMLPKDLFGWNLYLLCDPAGEKKKDNDYTVMGVIGLAPDGNYYLIEAIRDRLNLAERTRKIFYFHRKYNTLIKGVGYEKYGKDSDIEHIKETMEKENYRFEVLPLGGAMSKNDRIRLLVPDFEQSRFYIPHKMHFVDHEGVVQDFIHALIEDEYIPFPVGTHDDILDFMARIKDPKLCAIFPTMQELREANITMSNRRVNTVETEYDVLA